MTKKKTTPIKKGITDANWGGGSGGGVAAALSASSFRAIDKTLNPSDAYALSIDVRSAIHARNEPLSQGKLRLFWRKSMEEIVAGDIIDGLNKPSPVLNQSAMIYELGSFWDLAGEMIVGSIIGDKGIPDGWYPLNPFRLDVLFPLPAKHLAAVEKWRYRWDDGIIVQYGAESVVISKNFNPNSNVRGLPPVLAGTNEISSSYEAIAYNRRFFSNNAEPSHIVKLPNVTDPKLIEAFKEEYLSNHSIRSGNSHRVMFVGGSDVSIEQVSSNIKDTAFLGLQGLTTERIMRLYKVPPIHSGATPTPGYSVEEQNKVFAETALMPQAHRISHFIQMVIDRFYRNAKNVRGTGPLKLSKSMSERLEKARGDNGDSDVIVMLDIDHLPIISSLKSQKLEYAKQLQTTFKISPRAAAEEVGFEIEENDANDEVWVASTEQPYAQVVADAQAASQASTSEEPQAPNEADSVDDNDAKAERRQKAKQIARDLRALYLEKLDEGRVFRLAEADRLNSIDSETIKAQIRADYLQIKMLMRLGGDTKANTKNHLNKIYNRQFFKTV